MKRNESKTATKRKPQLYYHSDIHEPEGELVQLHESMRTYQMPDGSYTTVIGGESGLYMNEDQSISRIDPTLITIEEEPVVKNSRSKSSSGKSIIYKNKSGPLHVSLPEQITGTNGAKVENQGFQIELIPTEGEFNESIAEGNAIRYSNVFSGIDYQYTVTGNSLKEDIVLLEPVDKYTFSYRLITNGLKAKKTTDMIVIYKKSPGKAIFILSAPFMQDAAGAVSLELPMSLREQDGEYIITMQADQGWLSDTTRQYPIRIDPEITRGVEEGFKAVSVSSAYPNQNFSWNKPTYVGYDDGSKTGNNPGYGNCRTYFSLGFSEDTWNEIPRDAEISSARFLVDQQSDWSGGKSEFALEAPDKPWSIAMTWKEQQGLKFTRLGVQNAPGAEKSFDYDITEIMKEWLSGKRLQCGLTMRAIEEPNGSGSSAFPCELLYNQAGSKGPRIIFQWNGEQPDKQGIRDVKDLKVNVNPIVTPYEYGGRIAKGVLTHGLSQVDSSVESILMEDKTSDITYASEGKIYPDYRGKGMPHDAINNQMRISNWQSRGFLVGREDESEELELNTLYYFDVQATGVELETDEKTGEVILGTNMEKSAVLPTDSFLFYEVQQLDYLPRIATHYKVSEATIRKDNHLKDNLSVEGEILFIRNPQIDKPYNYYSPDAKTQLIIAMLLKGRLEYCNYTLEPVNMNTGNFYMHQVDASIPDIGGEFAISRSYNSIGAYTRSEFGVGWNSPFGERLMILEDGRIIFVKGDGGGMLFTSDKDGIYRSLDGHDMVLERVETLSESEMLVDLSEGWELTERMGNKHRFYSNGLLEALVDVKGNTTTFTYDKSSYLTRITSPSGKSYEISMDSDAKITSVRLSNGGSIVYGYDKQENLVSVTNAEKHTRHYFYDDDHRMLSYQDEMETTIVTNEYDKQSRVVRQTDAEGNTAVLSYEKGYTKATDNRGFVTEYHYDEQKRTTKIVYPDQSVEVMEYDKTGHVGSRTDRMGNRTTFTYDENGNRLTETRADGAVMSCTYLRRGLPLTVTDYEGNTDAYTYDAVGNVLTFTNGEGDTVHFEYDELNRMVKKTDANGGISQYAYEGAMVERYQDGEGNVWTFTYDAMNRKLTETDSHKGQKTFTYNGNEWITSETNADGGCKIYEYGPAGNVKLMITENGSETYFDYDKMYHIVCGTDALEHTLRYEYDEGYNKIKEIDAKGNQTSFCYDENNRLVKTTDPLGQTVKHTYDANGNLTSVIDKRDAIRTMTYDTVLGLPIITIDEMGFQTRYTYNRNGQIKTVTYADGSQIAYQYDRARRVVKTAAKNGVETTISYDGNGNMIRISDDDSRVYTYRYNHNNQLAESKNPLGDVTQFVYDKVGNQTVITDANGHNTTNGYDAVGRLTQIHDALGGIKQISYDLMGNMTSQTDENKHSKSYRYDPIGRLTEEKDAIGGITITFYDSLNNIERVVNAENERTSYQVDAIGQITRITDATQEDYQYFYDENSNMIKIIAPDEDMVEMVYDTKNRLIRHIDEAGVITQYIYDSVDRVVHTFDTAGNETYYQYDISGNLIKQTDTIGRDTLFSYDRFNRLTKVKKADQGITRYEYDALDRLTKVIDPEGKETSYTYDQVGNLTETTEPGKAIYTYAYDQINRLKSKVNPLGAITKYFYDAKGNLTGIEDAELVQTSYAYDAMDRLISMMDGKGNRDQYEYDKMSRLTAYQSREGCRKTYKYDSLGRVITEMDEMGNATNHEYDRMGNRIQTISPMGARISYTYNKHDELTSVTDAMGNTTFYKVDLNRLVTRIKHKNGGIYQYTYDRAHRLTSIKTPLGYQKTFTMDDGDNVIAESDNLGRVSTFTYDIMHRLTKTVNPEGGITQYGYDIRGNRAGVTNALGQTRSYQYDLIDQKIAQIDPEGKATRFTYNQVGKLASLTKPGDRTTRLCYDPNYNVKCMIDPRGSHYESSYDKDNRLTETNDPLNQKEAFSYDARNQLRLFADKMGTMTEYTYDPHGNKLMDYRQTRQSKIRTTYQYDLLNRLTSVTNPMGDVTSYCHDVMGNITSMTDAMKRTSTYSYDVEGNLTSIVNAQGRKELRRYDMDGRRIGAVSNGKNKIFYQYDKMNHLTDKSYADAKGNVAEERVRYGYDKLGQRVSMMDRSGESTYEYDSLGRIITVTTGSGEVTRYTYDGCDQLSGILYPDGGRVTYQYDKNDNLTNVIDRTGGVTEYQYDALNRVTTILRPNGIHTYNTYNARNQITTLKNMCAECGWVVSEYHYTYDELGQIINEKAMESLYDYAFDEKQTGACPKQDGLCPHGTHHNGKHNNRGKNKFEMIETYRTFTYDDNGRLLHYFETDKHQGNILYTYAYDEVGNRIRFAIEKDKDGLNIHPIHREEYTYNASNQMLRKTVYHGKNCSVIHYRYDKDGNRIAQTGKLGKDQVDVSYLYSVENRLKAVYNGKELLMAAAYDGDGNRIFQLNYHEKDDHGSQNRSGILFPVPQKAGRLEQELMGLIKTPEDEKNYELIEYVNDINREHTEVLMELNVNGKIEHAYSYGVNRLSSDRFTKEVSYYHYDPRGSVTGVTDENAVLWQSYRYEPYGNLSYGKPRFANVYAYNGESYNPNIESQYLRARYYDTTLGNFYSEDRYLGNVLDPLSLNRYNYCKCSPLNYVDPSGNMAKALLNTMLGLYVQGTYTDEDLAKIIIQRNGLGIYTALHEIAQIHVGAILTEKGYSVTLEQLAQTGQDRTLKNVQSCYEIDITAYKMPMVKSMAWEVKPITYFFKNYSFNQAHKKFDAMIDYFNNTFLAGDNSLIGVKYDIAVLGPIKMVIGANPIDPGFIYYSLYIEKKDENGNQVMVSVSNAEAYAYIKKRSDVSDAIIEFVYQTAVGSITAELKAGLGFSKGFAEEAGNNIRNIADYLAEAFKQVA